MWKVSSWNVEYNCIEPNTIERVASYDQIMVSILHSDTYLF